MSTVSGQSTNQEFTKQFFLRTMFFPVEHILERAKLEAQKHPEKPSITSIKNLWQLKGLKGFYEGSVANCTRRFVKEAYQMPLTIALNKFWKKHCPEEFNKDNLGTNLLTGLSVAALVQTGLTLPVDRILIEKTTKEGYLPFFRKLKMQGILKGIPVLYEAAQVTVIRHSFVWTTFFLSNHASSSLIKKVDSKNKYPNMSWIARALLTSTTVVGIGYPLEFLRNPILMELELLSKGTSHAVITLYRRYGLRNMYSGSAIVLLHNNIQVLFIQNFYDRMNKK